MSTERKQYVCINCSNSVRELHKKFSNTVKASHCAKCHQTTDKYIEFEEFIVLIDALLLSQQAFRHMIYNDNFKLYWKVSLVLLLLESFALCRQKRGDGLNSAVHEKGFYMCSLQNIGDYLLITLQLLIIAVLLGAEQLAKVSLRTIAFSLVKAVAIANLSKIFLLPILVWRNNTTDFGRSLHYLLVTGHHLCSLVLAYEVVCRGQYSHRRWLTAAMVIGAFVLKEQVRKWAAFQMELYFA